MNLFCNQNKSLNFRMDSSRSIKLFVKLVYNIFMAPITIAKVSARVYGKTSEKRNKWWPYAIPSVGLFLLFILFHLLELAIPGCWSIAWFFYLCFTCQITAVRIRTREIHSIIGNASEDFFSAMFLYPNVATQLDLTTELLSDDGDNKTNKSQANDNIDLEKIQTDNGDTINVNYGYEKE